MEINLQLFFFTSTSHHDSLFTRSRRRLATGVKSWLHKYLMYSSIFSLLALLELGWSESANFSSRKGNSNGKISVLQAVRVLVLIDAYLVAQSVQYLTGSVHCARNSDRYSSQTSRYSSLTAGKQSMRSASPWVRFPSKFLSILQQQKNPISRVNYNKQNGDVCAYFLTPFSCLSTTRFSGSLIIFISTPITI